jgi:hypothetical protein
MQSHYSVVVEEIVSDTTVPGRFAESGLWEIVEELGGPPTGDDVWAALAQAFALHTDSKLGEFLLDMVLLKPPIPAGCDALLQEMKDAEHPPWRDHEVAEDRFWLWYCHKIVHQVYPDRYPAPEIRRVQLTVTTLSADLRPPGKRSSTRDRTRFVANLLKHRQGDNPIAEAFTQIADSEAEWAFDTIWATSVLGRKKLSADELVALGATPADAATGKLFQLTIAAWLPPQWIGDLAANQTWTAA